MPWVNATWKPRMTLIHLFLEDYSSFDFENYPIFFQLTCVHVYECVCVCVCVCVYMLMCLLDEVSLCGLQLRKSHEFAFFLVILFILKFFLMISNPHFCSSPRFQPETKGNRKIWYDTQEPIKMTCCIIRVLWFFRICDSLFKTQVSYLAHL